MWEISNHTLAKVLNLRKVFKGEKVMNTKNENNVFRSRRAPIIWVISALVLLAIIAGLTVLWLTNRQTQQGCNPPKLVIGANQYTIETIQRESDGSLNVPANEPNTAFWVDGTNTNQVFALSPTANNLALQTSLKSGDTATVTWGNCNTTTYSLTDPQLGLPDNAALLDQSTSQVTIFLQPGLSTAGFVIEGELAEETIQSFNTPNPSETQAEISLIISSTSSDGKTVQVEVSILNNGTNPITLSATDVSLTPESGAQIRPESTDPALPLEIAPGATETIHITFPRPESTTAVLKIFTVEYDLENL